MKLESLKGRLKFDRVIAMIRGDRGFLLEFLSPCGCDACVLLLMGLWMFFCDGSCCLWLRELELLRGVGVRTSALDLRGGSLNSLTREELERTCGLIIETL